MKNYFKSALYAFFTFAGMVFELPSLIVYAITNYFSTLLYAIADYFYVEPEDDENNEEENDEE